MISLLIVLNIFNLILSFIAVLILLKTYINNMETLKNSDDILFEDMNNIDKAEIENMMSEVIEVEQEIENIEEGVLGEVISEVSENEIEDIEIVDTVEESKLESEIIEDAEEYTEDLTNFEEQNDKADDTEITLSDIAENALNRDFFNNKESLDYIVEEPVSRRRKLALKIVGSNHK